MTEAEWLAATDPGPMLVFLRGKVSERKLRLFSVACCRRAAHLLLPGAYRRALDLAEWFADQAPSPSRFRSANRTLWNAREGHQFGAKEEAAATAVNHCFHVGVEQFAEWAAACASGALALERYHLAAQGEPDYERLRAAARVDILPEQANLLREVIGDPFRGTAVDTAWLTRNGGTVPHLALAIYDALTFDRLPILADALEDAGCTEADLLHHLRSPGPHCRGCWALDFVLGKE
jgi:hypothetical protein